MVALFSCSNILTVTFSFIWWLCIPLIATFLQWCLPSYDSIFFLQQCSQSDVCLHLVTLHSIDGNILICFRMITLYSCSYILTMEFANNWHLCIPLLAMFLLWVFVLWFGAVFLSFLAPHFAVWFSQNYNHTTHQFCRLMCGTVRFGVMYKV